MHKTDRQTEQANAVLDKTKEHEVTQQQTLEVAVLQTKNSKH